MSPFSLQRPFRISLLVAFGALAATSLHAQGGANGVTERVSFTASGDQVSLDCKYVRMSRSGRYVLFATEEGLVPQDDNGFADVYVYDRVEQDLICASTGEAGVFGNGDAYNGTLSGNGRWVAFETRAGNLMPGDGNGLSDVYLRDLRTGSLQRISEPIGSGMAANGTSISPAISEAGDFVAFHSGANNLVPGDTNGKRDIFVRDIHADTLTRVSVGFAGEGNDHSYSPSVSDDGKRVSFHSYATNLVPGDVGGHRDVFVRDLDAGETLLVSRATDGSPGNADSFRANLSGDGQRLIFLSEADDLVAHDPNGYDDAFLADLGAGTIELVTTAPGGLPANGDTIHALLSRDGRYAALRSFATNLTPESSPYTNAFLRDLDAGETWLVSRPSGAKRLANEAARWVALSDGGRFAAVSSIASLDPADTNGVEDVYVRTIFADPTSYCDAASTKGGCLPQIASTGHPSATGGSGFEIRATAVPPLAPSMLFYGIDGRLDLPFHGGTLCVAPPILRTPMITSTPGGGACSGTLAFDMNAFATGALGGNPLPGLTSVGQCVQAQFWGRDPGGAPQGVFLTEALEFVVGP